MIENEKFVSLTDEELVSVDGGNARDAGEFLGAVAISAGTGAAVGGAFVPVGGAVPGALLGAIYGTAGWAFAKASKW